MTEKTDAELADEIERHAEFAGHHSGRLGTLLRPLLPQIIAALRRQPSSDQVLVPRERIPRLLEAVESVCRKAAVDNDERTYEVFTAIRRELRDAAAEAGGRKP